MMRRDGWRRRSFAPRSAQEDAQGDFLLLWQLVERCGCPLALYHDRHSTFIQTVVAGATRRETVAAELAGQPRPPTQFGRALADLGITSIVARSPQAKGRVERLFGTLQDRLVVELRLAGADTLEAANAVLAAYLLRFNAQFAVPAAVAETAYRPLEAGQRLEHRCCFKYVRVVGADNTVTLGPARLQTQPGPQRRSSAHAPVEGHERLDGRLAVRSGGQEVHTTPAPAEAPRLRARPGPRPGTPSAPSELAPLAAPAAPIGRNAARPDAPQPVQGGRRSGPRAPTVDHPWRRPLQSRARTQSVDT